MKKNVDCLLLGIVSMGLCTSAFSDSAFQGFDGQISTGYESNSFSSIKPSWNNVASGGFFNGNGTARNQNASGMPLVLGAGYFHEIRDKFLLGIGIDYSPLPQSTGNFGHTSTRFDGLVFPWDNMSYRVSNRVNVFLMPGYAFDTDKLGYLKLGYSTQQLKYTQQADPKVGFTSGFSSSASLSGFIVGLGYKQVVRDGFYGFAEANYISYARRTVSGSGLAITETIDVSSSPSVRAYNFLAGIGYKF